MVNLTWDQERSDRLTALIMTAGRSYAEAAVIINTEYGTNYSRNATIGRANRMGLQSPYTQKPRSVRIPRERKPRVVKERTQVIEGGFGSRRVVRQKFTVEQIQLRCVEIEPLHKSLLEVEGCRYPYGDGPITFCDHPQQKGSSYCTPHHDLCWMPARNRTETYFVRGAAA